MHPWAVAVDVAQRQHLMVARWQLRFVGLSDKAIQLRVLQHGWHRPFPGVLALPGRHSHTRRLTAALLAYAPPTRTGDRVSRLREGGMALVPALVAAALDAGPAVCSLSAAYLHGLLPNAPAHAWIMLPSSTSRAQRPGVRLRYASLAPTEVLRSSGLPVIDVPRTVFDLGGLRIARARRRRLLVSVIATADAKRLATVDGIADRLASAGSFWGKPLLDEVVSDLRGELSHSAVERRARRIAAEVVARYGYALHPRPYRIVVQGRTLGEADLAVVELRYDVEVDGPHHLLPGQRAADEQRDRRLRGADWTVERYPVELVDTDPAAFAAAIDATMRRLCR